jgi:hypothetical protein
VADRRAIKQIIVGLVNAVKFADRQGGSAQPAASRLIVLMIADTGIGSRHSLHGGRLVDRSRANQTYHGSGPRLASHDAHQPARRLDA